MAIAGDARTADFLGTGNADWAFDTTMAVLSAVAVLGVTARARDLTEGQLAAIAASISPLEWEMAGRPEAAANAGTLLGIFPLTDARFALGIALPFGQAEAKQLIESGYSGAVA